VDAKLKQEKFMRLALKLAQKAKGRTSPNPLVGAVVVKNNRVVGRGYHRGAGLAHAEVEALDDAGKAACGASLYVTLEPCCHTGRTPPCVQKITACGIKEVVFATEDPNPLNNGKGAQFLRRQGIKVFSSVLEREAKEMNRAFIKYITKKRPFVTVKVAQSLDGKIATRTGDSRWISSEASRKFTHKLRSRVDAVLVGINTVLQDDPLLTCRLNNRLNKRQPKKVIVDSRLRLRPDLKIFSSYSPAEVLVAVTSGASPKRVLSFEKNARIIIAKNEKGRVDLRDLLRKLAKQGIAHILVEGGGEIIASLLKKKLVDEMFVVIAPKIIGGGRAPVSVAGEGVAKVTQAIKLKDIKLKRIGPDLCLQGLLKN
jgi:diaminohydroxyphosphoribosylaminopyrimidine deaminase/5-amino-6-(5-phosphoribosylamino)uracil reductase